MAFFSFSPGAFLLYLVKRRSLPTGPAKRRPLIMETTNATCTGSSGFAPNDTIAGPGHMPFRPQPTPKVAAPAQQVK